MLMFPFPGLERVGGYDNILIERLWRTVKVEHVYLHDYADLQEARQQLALYFVDYNGVRPHQSLKIPHEVYYVEELTIVEQAERSFITPDSSACSMGRYCPLTPYNPGNNTP